MKQNDNIINTFKRAIYGRTLIIVLLILLQIILYFILAYLLKEYAIYVDYAFVAVGFVVAIHIISLEIDAYFKIAWLVPIMISPAFGAVLYLFIHLQNDSKNMHSKIKKNAIITYSDLHQNKETLNSISDEGFKGLAKYVFEAGHYPVYDNCDLEFYPLGDDFFPAILEEMEKAKKFIFLEFFIITPGYMWDRVLDVLKRKVKEGVEIRLMFDGFNTLSNLPNDYTEIMKACGINCKVFSPMKPVISSLQNNRDHRKILVVDGKVAFTGGNNLADEYINVIDRFGHWKDSSILIRGEAVKSFTMMFLRMWNSTGNESSNFADEIHHYVNYEDFEVKKGSGYVIPYGDCPFDKDQIGEYIYLDILYNAKKYVHIMTPYLVLNDSLRSALIHAAKRGVDVKIIMPGIPDKPYAFCVARTYYPELIEAGVKIYEYERGFVHAKEFICDDVITTVGTVNLDFRSLFLHFECGTLIYDETFAVKASDDFDRTLEMCNEFTINDYKSLSTMYRLTGKLLRVAAPLL